MPTAILIPSTDPPFACWANTWGSRWIPAIVFPIGVRDGRRCLGSGLNHGMGLAGLPGCQVLDSTQWVGRASVSAKRGIRAAHLSRFVLAACCGAYRAVV